MKKNIEIIKEVKDKLNQKKTTFVESVINPWALNHHWETPDQKKMYIDHITNVPVNDYPIMNYIQSYKDFVLSKTQVVEVPKEVVSEEESKKN